MLIKSDVTVSRQPRPNGRPASPDGGRGIIAKMVRVVLSQMA
jgi:hypothetical protein